MDVVENVVIVGAGIAGLATSLGLHRLGVQSLVLESADSLRITGFGLGIWTNAWRALDELGIGDSLRQRHLSLHGIVSTSTISGLQTSEISFVARGRNGDHELRCLRRKSLLEALASELPRGTIKFSSKVVSIEESDFLKLVHLADGTIIKTKVLVGCDGVNSVVAQWLGFKKPAFTGRYAIRGCLSFKSGHGLEPKFMQFAGKGVRAGIIPCDYNTIYWFFTCTPSSEERENEDSPERVKQYVLSKLGKMPDRARAVIEKTELEYFTLAALRYRQPWELLLGNIYKGSVCLAGDALHPMTPDIGQGGCSALEDSIILARCLAEAMLEKPSFEANEKAEIEHYQRIEMGLRKFTKERKWRSIELICMSYVAGCVQQSDGMVMNFLREKILPRFLAGPFLKRADFDCGKLSI